MVTFGLVRQTSVLTTNSVPSHVFTIHVNAPGVKFDARDVSNDMQKRFEKDLGIKEGERWFARITYDDQEGDDVQNESKLFQADLTLISKRDLKSTQVWVDTQTKKISVVDQNQASPTSRVMQRLGSFFERGLSKHKSLPYQVCISCAMRCRVCGHPHKQQRHGCCQHSRLCGLPSRPRHGR